MRHRHPLTTEVQREARGVERELADAPRLIREKLAQRRKCGLDWRRKDRLRMIQKQVSHRGFHLLDKTIDSLLLGMDLGPVDVERTLGALVQQNPQSLS